MQVGGQFHGEVLINPSPRESEAKYTMGRSGRLWIGNLEPEGENERSNGHIQSPPLNLGVPPAAPLLLRYIFFKQWPHNAYILVPSLLDPTTPQSWTFLSNFLSFVNLYF
eukprot:TRINITY_DN6219_c0_g1_i7.p1 TRINITY_DN6219_c0_g1~~TRINITY_DN6219_c0_g1_i7.p1  ORF type:complete len:110 (-),score=5.28 TRINITY_DN6219_c0_g1_i7:699-1028(-)